ncbi:hypothetical protein PUN28_006121 [Cardiocondyla obscurior]|uniref:Uncharacterized protein n=1 Tax=Cardiocondyla obscurior TaxID=286306 RepID=A0AAW2G8X3_9HYME
MRPRKGILLQRSNSEDQIGKRSQVFLSPILLIKRTVANSSGVARVSMYARKDDSTHPKLSGGGGPGRASCFGRATYRVIVAV